MDSNPSPLAFGVETSELISWLHNLNGLGIRQSLTKVLFKQVSLNLTSNRSEAYILIKKVHRTL